MAAPPQKELVTYHNPSTHPMGSFELIASNRIRSDEETLGEIFNGQPYYTDKEPAEDPDFDWVPRKEQVFSDKQLMQLSVWKKEWDDDTNSYEPIDLGYKPYGYQQTRTWKKLGFLDEEGKLKSEGQLIEEGKVTDPEDVANYYKKQDTIKVLREEYCFKRAHAVECANDKALKEKGSVEEALEWLRFHKERDFDEAMALKKKKDSSDAVPGEPGSLQPHALPAGAIELTKQLEQEKIEALQGRVLVLCKEKEFLYSTDIPCLRLSGYRKYNFILSIVSARWSEF